MNQLRVQPLEGRKVAVIDDASRPIRGRFLGYDADGTFRADPVLVPALSHYYRAAMDGDLVLVEEVVS